MLLDELCEGGDLPRHFVAKIFQDLVRQGLLTSAKGRGGGFALARKPEKICLLDIVTVVDGTDSLDECMVGMAECDEKQPCAMHDHFRPLRQEVRRFLEKTTLADMSQSLRSKFEKAGKKVPTPKSRSKPLRIIY
jgi:Rrf2 family protein